MTVVVRVKNKSSSSNNKRTYIDTLASIGGFDEGQRRKNFDGQILGRSVIS